MHWPISVLTGGFYLAEGARLLVDLFLDELERTSGGPDDALSRVSLKLAAARRATSRADPPLAGQTRSAWP